MAGNLLLRAHDLVVDYGRARALHGVSIEVEVGEIVAVIGANGAGKTTLLAALMGLRPFTGSVDFPQHRGAAASVVARVAAGICLVPETRDLFGSLSVEDNLRLGGFTRRNDKLYSFTRSLAEVFALFPRLDERRRQPARTLSGGERQMLALGRALMARPNVLFLDEPSLGLAPLIMREIFAIICALRDRDVSIVLVEQNALGALAIADRGYVLEAGRVVMQGAADVVASDPRVVESYLGAQAGI